MEFEGTIFRNHDHDHGGAPAAPTSTTAACDGLVVVDPLMDGFDMEEGLREVQREAEENKLLAHDHVGYLEMDALVAAAEDDRNGFGATNLMGEHAAAVLDAADAADAAAGPTTTTGDPLLSHVPQPIKAFSPVSSSAALVDPLEQPVSATRAAAEQTHHHQQQQQEDDGDPFELLERDPELYRQVICCMSITERLKRTPKSDSAAAAAAPAVVPVNFYWRQYPELVRVLNDHMEEYYSRGHVGGGGAAGAGGGGSRRMEHFCRDKSFNDRLLQTVKVAMTKYGYRPCEALTDRRLRDRIRGHYKTSTQNSCKRYQTLRKNGEKGMLLEIIPRAREMLSQKRLRKQAHQDEEPIRQSVLPEPFMTNNSSTAIDISSSSHSSRGSSQGGSSVTTNSNPLEVSPPGSIDERHVAAVIQGVASPEYNPASFAAVSTIPPPVVTPESPEKRSYTEINLKDDDDDDDDDDDGPVRRSKRQRKPKRLDISEDDEGFLLVKLEDKGEQQVSATLSQSLPPPPVVVAPSKEEDGKGEVRQPVVLEEFAPKEDQATSPLLAGQPEEEPGKGVAFVFTAHPLQAEDSTRTATVAKEAASTERWRTWIRLRDEEEKRSPAATARARGAGGAAASPLREGLESTLDSLGTLHAWIRVRLAAGSFRSAIKLCHGALLQMYREASDMLVREEQQEDKGDSHRRVETDPDSLTPRRLAQIRNHRDRMAAAWCLYAQILLEVGELHPEEVEAAAAAAGEGKAEAIALDDFPDYGRGRDDDNGNDKEFVKITSDDWHCHVVAVLSAVSSCPLVGNHHWISIALARTFIRYKWRHCRTGAGANANSVAADANEARRRKRSLRDALAVCWDGIDRAHARPHRLRFPLDGPGPQELFVLAHYDPDQDSRSATSSCMDTVTADDLETSFREVMALPTRLLPSAGDRRTRRRHLGSHSAGSHYLFADTRSAVALCVEMNRLSRLAQKVSGMRYPVLAPPVPSSSLRASLCYLDRLDFFRPVDLVSSSSGLKAGRHHRALVARVGIAAIAAGGERLSASGLEGGDDNSESVGTTMACVEDLEFACRKCTMEFPSLEARAQHEGTCSVRGEPRTLENSA